MAFAELSVAVEGILESEETCHDETLVNFRIGQIGEDAADDGAHTVLYVTFHEHDEGAECACAQYLTSHQPYREFNGPVDTCAPGP